MMKTLSAHDLVRIWESGQKQHTVDRALTILAHAYPEESHDRLANLTLGIRDRRLMRIRERIFGSRAQCLHTCPACNRSVEFEVDTQQIMAEERPQTEHTLEDEQYRVTYRLFNSQDLATIVDCPDATHATTQLIERCIIEARHDGQRVDATRLPATVLDQLQDAIIRDDPQSEILMDLLCPDCQTPWQAVFDIAAYLWAEIENKARHLLQDVHVLARAYGWKETDVFALSDVRRQWYLEAIGA